MPSRDYSVLSVGLDGATFDLMLPWIDQGVLPHLGRLLRGGAHGPLESTIPPITPCAWSSFMTGKNPGKHGLFDFIEPDGRGGFNFTNATYRDGETLWGRLSRKGRPVGIVNVPMTYPPEQVDGFMISGLDTPHERSPFMHPPEVREELRAAGIRYRIDQQYLGNMRTHARRRRQLADILDAESARTAAFQQLSRKTKCDLRMIVYGATDQVQHHFWHFMDPTHDKHDASGAAEFRHAIRDTYRHVDDQLGKLLADCDENTIVVVMSDHGFGPMSNVRLRLNQVLSDEGLLKFAETTPTARWKQTLGRWVDNILRSTLSADAKRTIAGLLPRLRTWFENLDEAEVDWSATSAYVNEAYRSSPAVWLNRGLGADETALRAAGDRAEQILLALRDPATGRPVVSEVVRPREIYHGPHTSEAPDLLPSWWTDGFLLEQSAPGLAPGVERSTAPLKGGVEFAASHRLDGVLMMSGGPIVAGAEFAGAKIVDVAPTVLYLMGEAVPDDMDGRVLLEALDDDFVIDRPVTYESTDGLEDETQLAEDAERMTFSDNESELIAQRLQALGYIK
ncbi:MAG TPA: alkaline phosphatase family protein [Lacipirellulaceae bacterium]|nr:alkaline phosphatase family protein [Lacipirellulaceae bacterium]